MNKLLIITTKILKFLWTNEKLSNSNKNVPYTDEKTVGENYKTVELKPSKPFNKYTIDMFNDWKTDGKIKGMEIASFNKIKPFDYSEFKGNIKNIKDKNLRLKILYYYLAKKTKKGIFKKESNKIIAEYLGCKQDLIRDLFNELRELKYFGQVNEIELTKELKQIKDYYKILKDWSV